MEGRAKQEAQKLPFFVYGTLLPGQPNAFLWQGLEVGVVSAVFGNGRLYDLGGYPMLVETGTESVQGKLLTIAPDFYEIVVARLDFLEGFDPRRPDSPGYRRVIKVVSRENGRSTPAWVYLGQTNLVNGRVPIPHGNWITYTRQQNQNHINLFPPT